MCKYCESEYELPSFGLNTKASIKEGKNDTHYLYFYVMGYTAGLEDIKYCPYCGRKLNESI